MKFLAIDPATDKFGYCIFDNDQLIKHRFYNISNLLDKPSIDKRIDFVKKVVSKCLDDDKEICLVALEDIYLNTFGGKYSNYNSFKTLAQLQGVIHNELFNRDILYVHSKPSEWRSTCGIKGKNKELKKLDAIRFVKEKYNVDAEEDLAESICIAYHTYKKIIPKIQIKSK